MAISPRVLVVDEDLDSRVATRRALQRAQLELVAEVGFGTEAITAASDARPDVILISVEQPVSRPIETAESLANVLPETPYLFYASLNDIESARRAALYGARDYLLKPLQAEALLQSVTRALEFEEKRHMRRAGQLAAAPVRGTLITVTGAKGGIGKSVLAVNLAMALRLQTGSDVVVIDADTSFGDVATMLDLTPATTAADLLRDLDKVDRSTIENYLVKMPEGLRVLACPPDVYDAWETAEPQAGRRIVDLLSLGHDFVVVDTSGGMDKYTRAFIEPSTLILLVTTGEVSSVRDTKAALTRLNNWGVAPEKIKLILNRGARVDGVQLVDLEKAFDRPFFWDVPRDREVGRSIQIGRPLVLEKPDSPAARNILALASAIGGNTHTANQRRGLFSFKRLARGKLTS